MLQFYAEITQILRNLRNRYALLRRLRSVTHRYADGNLLMGGEVGPGGEAETGRKMGLKRAGRRD